MPDGELVMGASRQLSRTSVLRFVAPAIVGLMIVGLSLKAMHTGI